MRRPWLPAVLAVFLVVVSSLWVLPVPVGAAEEAGVPDPPHPGWVMVWSGASLVLRGEVGFFDASPDGEGLVLVTVDESGDSPVTVVRKLSWDLEVVWEARVEGRLLVASFYDGDLAGGQAVIVFVYAHGEGGPAEVLAYSLEDGRLLASVDLRQLLGEDARLNYRSWSAYAAESDMFIVEYGRGRLAAVRLPEGELAWSWEPPRPSAPRASVWEHDFAFWDGKVAAAIGLSYRKPGSLEKYYNQTIVYIDVETGEASMDVYLQRSKVYAVSLCPTHPRGLLAGGGGSHVNLMVVDFTSMEVKRVEGVQEEHVEASALGEIEAHWSPDCRRVAIAGRTDPRPLTLLVVDTVEARVALREEYRFSPDPHRDVVWSPRGDAIAYEAPRKPYRDVVRVYNFTEERVVFEFEKMTLTATGAAWDPRTGLFYFTPIGDFPLVRVYEVRSGGYEQVSEFWLHNPLVGIHYYLFQPSDDPSILYMVSEAHQSFYDTITSIYKLVRAPLVDLAEYLGHPLGGRSVHRVYYAKPPGVDWTLLEYEHDVEVDGASVRVETSIRAAPAYTLHYVLQRTGEGGYRWDLVDAYYGVLLVVSARAHATWEEGGFTVLIPYPMDLPRAGSRGWGVRGLVDTRARSGDNCICVNPGGGFTVAVGIGSDGPGSAELAVNDAVLLARLAYTDEDPSKYIQEIKPGEPSVKWHDRTTTTPPQAATPTATTTKTPTATTATETPAQTTPTTGTTGQEPQEPPRETETATTSPRGEGSAPTATLAAIAAIAIVAALALAVLKLRG